MDSVVAPSFEHVFNQAAACLLMRVYENKFVIEAVSDKYLALTSTRREDLIGKDPFDIFPDKEDHPDGAISTRNAILQVWKTGKPVIIPDYLYYIHSPASGHLEPYWWRSTFEPILDDSGAVKFVLGTAVDQTSQHLVHLNLDKAEEMLRLAIEAADIGTWSIEVESKAIVSSARSKALYGLPEDEYSTLEGVLNAIHPDYRKKAADTLNEVMNSDGKRSFIIDYPVRGIADQQERWVRSTAKLFLETADNKPVVCGTLVDITESKSLEQKQNDFISMVSHEMKSPLTVVTAYLDLVLEKAKKLNDGLISSSLFRARVQTSKLKNMIIGFLDMAHMEDGKLSISKSRFSFRELAEEVINEMLPFAAGHQLIFEQGPDIMLLADRAKTGQVISNLLSNAIKYSAPNTKIRVGYSATARTIKITITDQGIGIEPEHQQKLFDRFYRVDYSHRSKSGFGIGLYLAAEIVRAHKGKIGVRSTVGEGSTFWFTLPL
jgi:two-component system sensor histidine kinase VicK